MCFPMLSAAVGMQNALALGIPRLDTLAGCCMSHHMEHVVCSSQLRLVGVLARVACIMLHVT